MFQIIKLVKTLTEAQKQVVVEMGFGGLLKIQFETLPMKMVHELVKSFVPQTRLQHVGSDKYWITKDDVHDIFGLPINGDLVKEVNLSGGGHDSGLRYEWKKFFGTDAYGNIPCDRLASLIESSKDTGSQFRKYFVMYVMSVFFSPTARGQVDYKLVDLVEDVDSIPKFDWCEYVLRKLCEAISSYESTNYSCVNACVVVLMMCFMHRFPFRGEESPSVLPLVCNWDEKRVKEIGLAIAGVGLQHSIMTRKVFPLTHDGLLVVGNMGSCNSINYSDRMISFEIPEDLPSDSQICSMEDDVSVFLCF